MVLNIFDPRYKREYECVTEAEPVGKNYQLFFLLLHTMENKLNTSTVVPATTSELFNKSYREKRGIIAVKTFEMERG